MDETLCMVGMSSEEGPDMSQQENEIVFHGAVAGVKMSESSGIIFDCDGTLVDSLGQALDSFNYALDRLGEAPRTPDEIKRYFGSGADRIFLRLLGDERRALAAFDLYVEHQSELASTMRLHVGVRELLEELSERGVPMGIVTGRHARDLDVILKPHGIKFRFKVLVADSQLPHSKPAPDGILLAAREMGLSLGATLYVGDSVMDIQAARSAGCKSAGAVWDRLARQADLSHAGADFLVEHPQRVLDVYLTMLSPSP